MLPPPPSAVSTNAPATAATEAPADAADDGKDDEKAAANAIKQFAPSEDADGNPTPVPTVSGVDFADMCNEMYSALAAALAKRGITDVPGFLEDADGVDKTQFPGNKAGRVAYNTIRGLVTLGKQYDLLNKQRGVGGAGAMKKKLEEKENKIAELEKKLADLIAKMGG